MAEEGKKKEPLKEGGNPEPEEDEIKETEPEGGQTDPEEGVEPEELLEGGKEGQEPEKILNLDDLLKDPAVQAAFDAKVQETVATVLQEKLGAEEAERLAGMTPEERADYEADKKAQELDAREKALAARERKAAAIEELGTEQLPAALADCFNYDSDESYRKSKESVVKAFQDALKSAVYARLRSNGAPKVSGEGAKGSGAARKGSFAEIVRNQRSRR